MNFSLFVLSDCQVQTPSDNAVDDVIAGKLYTKSLTLIKPYVRVTQINHEE